MIDENQIKDWVKINASGLMPDIPLQENEIEHITMCLDHLVKWYYEDYPIGNFLTAVVKNDFTEACFQADGTNRKSLYLYALFLANKLPFDYRIKANPKLAKTLK